MPVKQHGNHVEIEAGNAKALIALHGAAVYSFVVGGQEHLFTSSKASLDGPAAIRGGIPICWPVFGPPPSREPYTKLKQHGFARISKWTFAGGDDTSARFTLSPNEETRKVYEPAFELEYIVSIRGKSLETVLKVTNPSAASSHLDFQALFHTYLRLPDGVEPSTEGVSVTPLQGLSFVDKVQDAKTFTEERDAVIFDGEVDRVYASVPETKRLDLPGGKAIEVKTENLSDLTVWNPHKSKSDAIGDMEADGWKRFVCVEPGQVNDWVKLAPGDSWTGSQTISV